MNCGYGRGSSVLEVIETVKRVSGVDFEVRMAERREGDPSELVAGTNLIHERLPWQPEFYAVYPEDRDEEAYEPILTSLKQHAADLG